jgi:peptide/nickel transport system permease protein
LSTYIIRRLIFGLIILIIVILVVFFMMRLLPGDPVLMFVSREQFSSFSPEQLDIIRHEFGLDKPMIIQFFDWIGGLFRGDLGRSLYYNDDVSKLLLWRLPITLHIGAIAFVISNIIGVVAGMISALRRGKAADLVVTLLANIGITMPIFWLGILLIYVFGFTLAWVPTNGYTSPFDDFWMSSKQVIMPIICLSIFTIGAIARQTRSSMLEVIRQDYVRTAWSKGLRERSIVVKHIMKNGLIPIITLAGMQVSQIIGGSVLIETVFNIPGMGRLAVNAVQTLDYAVVEAVILFVAAMVVMSNIIVDITYGWLDPRIRYG